ncbi:aminotransferase class III-fold pyridoxal phosphate-dependent enzyme [Kordiimonas sp. SCSIO 12603]|uniref:aminotransferase class III-fold pyridoxal phosphate-dependent enzyme n=1 Tax=Kordiimonas sp. SCSIO 12603 TaxID=2829596 RepID=UPI0021039DEC|nr:aminotransferase class III-fold pyridoxal phosphate-dependent enzyme [Kordiimonas sp. SCSIO 12603]UTW59545.1 aminotransferase class III-fold pyridoxal phosphate-dependent enzyme [Kordiimonas sp. SCSIO 12603]
MSQSLTPSFDEATILEHLSNQYDLKGTLKALASYSDQNFLLKTETDNKLIVKIANRQESFNELDMQNAAMGHLTKAKIAVPHVLKSTDGAEISFITNDEGTQFHFRVLSFLEGQFYAEAKPETHGTDLWTSLGTFLGTMDNALKNFKHTGAYRFFDWDLAHGYSICQSKKVDLNEEHKGVVEHFLSYYHSHIMSQLGKLETSVIHNDANDYNILIDNPNEPKTVTGLIDFGDMVHSHTINELAIACAYALLDQHDPIETLKVIVSAYHQARPLSVADFEVLYGLIALRLCTTLCNAATEYKKHPDNEYLLVSVRPAFDLLKKLKRMAPFAIECQLKKACGIEPDNGQAKEDIHSFRQQHLGKTLSLSFKEPLKIVRGLGPYLYDENGTEYLDMVNNVCHVGHCHPKVVAAGQAQMAKLNTNTRFLHDNLVDYAEKLLTTMPEKLSVCMFVNSGSEANELAFRLARNFTGSRELLTVEGAYHGNTNACIEASPYKFDGPGGEGAPDYVHKVMLPDPYRGTYVGTTKETGKKYASDVKRAILDLESKGKKPGAFICESLQGVAGQIIMPEGYLEHVYEHIRSAGGVCIADEVQVGFGRVGTHMWAFETQGVVPDIVTLGKPIGNGHPLAAVITTQEIADAFVTGMEYFNTFGGNPVSCAIGMAVLDVIKDEGLKENALEVGAYFKGKLQALQQGFEILGDVRGLGLFLGVEMVRNRDTKEPATEETAELIEYLKERHIILSTEGPFHNILKIKPPIVFSKEDADRFLKHFENWLQNAQ